MGVRLISVYRVVKQTMKQIELTRGLFALVDAEDYDHLMKTKWYAHGGKCGKFYATAKIGGKAIRLHNLLARPPCDMEVDHINGNSLDNRKKNLRICTRAQNGANTIRKRSANSLCKYRGTNINPRGRFQAQINVKGKKISLGTFDLEVDAAKAYNAAAQKYFGEFARLNAV